MEILNVGDRRVPLFGRMIGPGESREINLKQWPTVAAQYPGMFLQVGKGEVEVEVEGEDAGGEGELAETSDGLAALGLSVRVREVLRGAGVTAVGLEGMSDGEILDVKGIGAAGLEEILGARGVVEEVRGGATADE
jgi:DNA-directed RNA polymerase alpha subunit